MSIFPLVVALLPLVSGSPTSAVLRKATPVVDAEAEAVRLLKLHPFSIEMITKFHKRWWLFDNFITKHFSYQSKLAREYSKLSSLVRRVELSVEQFFLKVKLYDKHNLTSAHKPDNSAPPTCERVKMDLGRIAWTKLLASRSSAFARLHSVLEAYVDLEERSFVAKNRVEAFLHNVFALAADLLFDPVGTDGADVRVMRGCLSGVGREALCEAPTKHELAAHVRLQCLHPFILGYTAAMHNHLFLGMMGPGVLGLVEPKSFRNIADLAFHDQDKFFMFRAVRIAHLLWEIRQSRGQPAVRLSVAEIGVASGNTSQFVLENVPNLDYMCIDPFLEVDNPTYFLSEPGMRNLLRDNAGVERVTSRLAAVSEACREDGNETRHSSCFRMLVDQSTNAASSIEPASMDFVFIDAEHSFDAVVADVRSFLPKLRRTAGAAYREGDRIASILAGHDCCEVSGAAVWPGVLRALQSIFGEVLSTDEAPVIHFGHDDTWWIYFA
eukprot:TRINITY_DN1677_c0_g1_i2.p1 TRINITY_DN1677_c0_g1~~TRINITY_DN1677_c0_g1_i2.p1  ORF type:complete len:496 (+),score=49.54 TRINITY_DN1677_c0_g1_i2:78-1565(+)